MVMTSRSWVRMMAIAHGAVFFGGCGLIAGLGDTPSLRSDADAQGSSEAAADGQVVDDASEGADGLPDSGAAGDEAAPDVWVPMEASSQLLGDAPGDSLTEMAADAIADFAAVDAISDLAAADAEPWSPTRLPGLALWLDGASAIVMAGEGGAVVGWRDQSPYHSDATAIGSPMLLPHAIGGLPAVRLNGDFFVVPDVPSLRFGTNDFAIAMVLAHTTPTDGAWGYGLLYSKQQMDGHPYVGAALVANTPINRVAALWAQVELEDGGFVETPGQNYNQGQAVYLTMHRYAAGLGLATLDLRVGGVLMCTVTSERCAVDVSAVGSQLALGGTLRGQYVTGDIAEVVAIEGALAQQDIDDLEHYLKAKYGL
jgi:hypothetical protein